MVGDRHSKERIRWNDKKRIKRREISFRCILTCPALLWYRSYRKSVCTLLHWPLCVLFRIGNARNFYCFLNLTLSTSVALSNFVLLVFLFFFFRFFVQLFGSVPFLFTWNYCVKFWRTFCTIHPDCFWWIRLRCSTLFTSFGCITRPEIKWIKEID